MDEEYSENTDMSLDIDISDTAVTEDVPEDIPDNIPEDDFGEVQNDSSDTEDIEDIQEDVDISTEDSSDMEDISDEIPEDIENDSSTENMDTIEDIPEDTLTDADEDMKEADTEDTLTDADEDTKDADAEDTLTDADEDTKDADAEDTLTDADEDTKDADAEDTLTDADEDTKDADAEDILTDADEDTKDVDAEDTLTDADEDTKDTDAEDTLTDADEDTKDADAEDTPLSKDLGSVTSGNDGGSNDPCPVCGQRPCICSKNEASDNACPICGQNPCICNSAMRQLLSYMNEHNYGIDDYAEYSQDPIWKELHQAVYPNDRTTFRTQSMSMIDVQNDDVVSGEIISAAEILERFGVSETKNGSDYFVHGANYERFEQDYYSPEESKYTAFDVPVEKEISPNLIEGIHLGKSEVENPDFFWEQHEKGGTAESFQEIASYIPEVKEKLAGGATLQELNEDPKLSSCANVYFINKPKVIENNGYYEFDSNGRHRILAARALGYDIPVEVVGIRTQTADNSANFESSLEFESSEGDVSGQMSQNAQEGLNNIDIRDTLEAFESKEYSDIVHTLDEAFTLNEDEKIPVEVFKEHQLKPLDEKIEIADHNSNILDWEGNKGNSKRIPKDPNGSVAKMLSEYGIDGIEYKDGNVDFSPVVKYEVEFENTDDVYTKLSESIKIGSLDSRSDFNSTIRRKWQSLAIQEIVDRINNDPEFASQLSQDTGINTSAAGKRGKMNADILHSELSRNGLTMHETPDCRKIQFVPTVIHDTFKHSGGTSEMLERLLSGDIRGCVYNSN